MLKLLWGTQHWANTANKYPSTDNDDYDKDNDDFNQRSCGNCVKFAKEDHEHDDNDDDNDEH